MTVLVQYAVRVKGTDMYLPRPQRSDGRGGSYFNPVDFSKPKGERGLKPRYDKEVLIRTFSTKRAAQNLLSSWLQGQFRAEWEYEDDYLYIVGPLFIKGSSREHMREHMEIVELQLMLP